MSKYSGRRVARGPERPTADASAPSSPVSGRTSAGRGLFLLAGGITVTLISWGVLVFIAIEFGRQARTGSTTAWGLLGLATVGAAACLYLTLLLAMKTIEVMQRKPSLPAVTPPMVPSPRVIASGTSAPSSSSAPPPPSPASSSTPSPSSAPASSSSPSARTAPRRARQPVQHSRRAASRTPGKRVKR